MNNSGYVNVDALQAQTSLEAAAARCGVTLDAKGSGKEVRIDCSFGCAGDHAGRKEISVNTENPQKVFCCHAYGCQFRGNLLTLMHGWLSGQRPAGEKLKGEEFNRVKKLLQAEGSVAPTPVKPPVQAAPAAVAPPERNVPLEDSEEEKVRELATIDQKLIRDVAAMNPAAAAYIRTYPSFPFEPNTTWRCGYMPQDGHRDKRGWSLRGHILYPLLSEEGKVLSWIGRDPAYEEKERAFQSLAPAERADKAAPTKHKLPKGFHRGQELYGQHAGRLKEPGYREFIAAHGIVVVEGFNDVIGLDNLGIPAVGLMSNRITAEQVEKIKRFALHLASGKVLLMLDGDSHGDEGAKEALWLLSQQNLDVRLAWSQAMHDGAFRGTQPEQLTRETWDGKLRGALRP